MSQNKLTIGFTKERAIITFHESEDDLRSALANSGLPQTLECSIELFVDTGVLPSLIGVYLKQDPDGFFIRQLQGLLFRAYQVGRTLRNGPANGVTYDVVTGQGFDTVAPTHVRAEPFRDFEKAWSRFEEQTKTSPEKEWQLVRQEGAHGKILRDYRPV